MTSVFTFGAPTLSAGEGSELPGEPATALPADGSPAHLAWLLGPRPGRNGAARPLRGHPTADGPRALPTEPRRPRLVAIEMNLPKWRALARQKESRSPSRSVTEMLDRELGAAPGAEAALARDLSGAVGADQRLAPGRRAAQYAKIRPPRARLEGATHPSPRRAPPGHRPATRRRGPIPTAEPRRLYPGLPYRARRLCLTQRGYDDHPLGERRLLPSFASDPHTVRDGRPIAFFVLGRSRFMRASPRGPPGVAWCGGPPSRRAARRGR